MAISPKPSDARMPDDLRDDQNSEHEKEEQEYEEKDRDTTAPTTPEPPAEVDLMHLSTHFETMLKNIETSNDFIMPYA